MHPLIPYFQTIEFTLPLPAFFPIHQATVYGFGIAVALGIIAGQWIAVRRVRRLGLDVLVLYEALFWIVLGVVVGGHLGYGLFYHPREYFATPRLFLDLSGGLSSIGGFAFSTVAVLVLLRRRRQPVWPYLDSIMIGLACGWFFGRVGCTINHEHPGSPTRFFLGRFCRPVEGHTIQWPQWMTRQVADLRFSHCVEPAQPPVTSYSDQVPVDFSGVVGIHDMGLYEALFALGLLALFLALDRKPRVPGYFVVLAIALYAPVRFLMDFLRPEASDPRYLHLTPAQWGMIALALVGIWGMRLLRAARKGQ